ncbi:Hypothetical protein BC94_0122 [Mycoplasmopsis bovis]|uniref:Uncharacterized protein n=1 Tax=Mycoplasmopsis bovis TaxID=28903 RepID=A0A8D4D5X2_MYCBV|nr:Hypothetical protein BC94_0122 [Mycoplasmopsis bovis]AMW26099.1 Hypothetical protein BC93_0122 [Mycoplasmopsis bovis]
MAPLNIFFIFETFSTFHDDKSWLKAAAFSNICSIFVTFSVFQLEMLPLNVLASSNILYIVVTLDVSHLSKFWLNASADVNIFDISLTLFVFQLEISVLNFLACKKVLLMLSIFEVSHFSKLTIFSFKFLANAQSRLIISSGRFAGTSFTFSTNFLILPFSSYPISRTFVLSLLYLCSLGINLSSLFIVILSIPETNWDSGFAAITISPSLFKSDFLSSLKSKSPSVKFSNLGCFFNSSKTSFLFVLFVGLNLSFKPEISVLKTLGLSLCIGSVLPGLSFSGSVGGAIGASISGSFLGSLVSLFLHEAAIKGSELAKSNPP